MSKRAMKNGIGGFGLIEIMVGLVIGLIAILVIGQVTATFEGQKRASTGGGDAQTNGMVALSTLTHEMTMAGTGLVTPGLGTAGGTLMCPLGITINGSSNILAPVRIIDGGTASDSITVVRSDAEFGQLATNVRKSDFTASPPSVTVDAWTDSRITSGAINSLTYNDTALFPSPVVLLIPNPKSGDNINYACTLLQVSGIDRSTLSSETGPPSSPAWHLRFDASYPYNGAAPARKPNDGDILINMGMSVPYNGATQEGNLTINRAGFVYRQYGVQCGKLAASDPSQMTATPACTNTSPLVDEIVYLKAQYGVAAAAGSQDVVAWHNAQGAWASPLSAANIALIKAVRIAVVARSPQYEKSSVSPASITLWDTTGFAGADAAPVFAVPDQQYRYKVFTTVVPIKTVIWGKL